MTERSSYEPGTPSWIDLSSPDIDGSVGFYGELFGWDVYEAGGGEETGGYRMAYLREKPVAGMAPIMQEGQPPAWQTYVSVSSADETAEKVKEAGGQVLFGPMDVLDVGRMAVFMDPAGAAFAIWQPRTHPGAGIVNEPGSFGWNELNTRDPDAAKSFYAAVFGWNAQERDMGDAGPYTTMKLADAGESDDSIAGMIDMRGRVPDEVPPHWLTYFTAADCDASAEKVKELGGTIAFGPIDLPVGRFAVAVDPQGAAFALFEDRPGESIEDA